MKKLTIDFYSNPDVLQIAINLLGKILVSNIDGVMCTGSIVETEAYIGLTDKASHSFGGKRTARNEHMYGAAGLSYVYICYGMHHLFNVVTNQKEIPDAVLIRAIEPIKGIEEMLKRTNKKNVDFTLTKGPGNVAKALGITKDHSGKSLLKNEIYLADNGTIIVEKDIGSSKRIGCESAGADGLLPYRFYLKGNKYVSGSPVT